MYPNDDGTGPNLSPQEELLTAVQTGDEVRLQGALLIVDDVNHVYGHPVNATALHVAAQNRCTDLVKALLEKNANPNVRDLRGNRYTPLHYAASEGDVHSLKVLLSYDADPNAKEGAFGRTSLHLLTQNYKSNEDKYKECLDTLLSSKKIKVDSSDSRKCTPLFLAAQKGWEYMTRQLILKGANVDAVVGNKTARNVIQQKLPGLLETIDFSVIAIPERSFGDELYDAMKIRDLDLFDEILCELEKTDTVSKKVLEEHHGDYTLLQYACDNCLPEFVKKLLEAGADPAGRDETTCLTPMLYAARQGYHVIIGLLIEAMSNKSALKAVDRKKESALHKIVKRNNTIKIDDVNYSKCLDLLLREKQYLDLDAKDDFDNTPLHYAVLCDDQSFVKKLLLNGANLGIKNCFGTLAITRIQPLVLKEVLNDCIEYKNNITDKDFEIILHYSLLAPATDGRQPETECLRFLSNSPAHKHLLRHPIIDTFLFLKWQKIKTYYFMNILAYSIYLIFLTAYILIFHSSHSGMAGETDKNNIPSMISNSTNASSVPSEDSHSVATSLALQLIIIIFTLYIAIREFIQCFMSWKYYVSSVENWLEVSIVVMTFVLLLIPMDPSSKQNLSAWLILFSWGEFVLLLGRHPWLAVYITMFTTVSYNFLKFITMFSFVVIAFSLSFFLMFQVGENFTTYPKALVKTLAMSTGEMEYSDLPVDTFPISSHLLFVLFMFLIVLVLLNLLNGLAVNDIQQIHQEAEIVSYISRVELIFYIESVFLGRPLQQIMPGPITCCDTGSEECCTTVCLDSPSSPFTRVLHWLGKHVLMFHTCLRNRKVQMYPNRGSGRWYVCKCHSFELEENMIEAAKTFVLAEQHKVADRIVVLEERIEAAIKAIADLTHMVKNHVLCPSPK
ncbi:uncharacterized protein LOC143033015 [Oratosquilla oratoria]|uniref:uncharacterized protein LOC143033015 n=1 Tax=Oratosquilla oratoria TaxID=337810 RepID=UPI003F769C0C